MANTILMKNRASDTTVPTPTALKQGELAVNSFDGSIFMGTKLGISGAAGVEATASTRVGGRIFDEDDLSSNSATGLASQQSIKAYVDSSAGLITGVTAGTGLTGGGSTGDITLNAVGGTGLATNANDIALSHLGIESLSDPNADRIMFWDDSAGATAFLTAGSGLSISGTTITATDTQPLTTEQVQDIVGGMFTSNTETRIAVTYEDGDGTIDLVVDDMTANDNTWRTVTAGGNTLASNETLAFTAGSNMTITENAGAVTLTATNTQPLTTEQVQDIVGGMLVGTETRIGVTYDDANGEIDFVVDDMTANDNTWRTVTAGGNTLASNETLAFTAGNNMTISESAGAVTLNAADPGVTSAVAGDGIDVSGATGAVTISAETASATNPGVVELATTGETTTGTDTARAVTPAGVQAAIDALVDSAPGALDTLNELAASIGDDASYATTVTNALGAKAALASPTFTGTVVTPDLTLTDLANQGSEATAVMINGSNVVGTRELGSNAFNSTTIPTNNNQITNGAGYITATLTTENVQDIVGAMLVGTETRIGVTYDDANGEIDFVVDDMTANDNTWRGVTAGGNTLASNETLAFTAGTNITITESAGAVTITSANDNTQLSTENVQDIVGAMLVGTETRIGVTYDDANGEIDFVVDDMTANDNTNQLTTFTLAGDSGSSQTIAHGNTLTVAGGTGLASVASGTDTVTLNIDTSVCTLTGSQTLTNKTIDAGEYTTA